jgi:carboxyl-terminal processing protease
VNAVPPVLPELKRRSESRVASDPDFAYVREEIARYKKVKEEKLVSLNEAQRMKEKQENEARLKARKDQLRARPEPKYKVYDISLKNADMPGLPPATNIWAAIKASAKTVARSGDTPEKVSATNSVAKASASSSEEDDAEKDDSPVPGVDISMEEGWRILHDLVSLTSKPQLSRTKGASTAAHD